MMSEPREIDRKYGYVWTKRKIEMADKNLYNLVLLFEEEYKHNEIKTIIIPDLKTRAVRMHEADLPLGTLFEVLTLVLLNCVVAELMHQLTTPEAAMATRHANIQE